MPLLKSWVKKRKTLTISGSPKPKHRTVIIKKPSKTKLSDTWQDRRIDAINRKIKKFRGPKQDITEDYAQEASDIYKSKAQTKKSYKVFKRNFIHYPKSNEIRSGK